MTKPILLLFALGLAVLPDVPVQTATAQSQDLAFERIPAVEQPISVVQDHLGFMWFGTYDGLVRYDGYRQTVFRNDPADSTSLSGDRVENLYVDRQGVLWVGTRGGLNRFDPVTETFTRFQAIQHNPDDPNSLSHNVNNTPLEDQAGDFWFATAGGLHRMDRETGTFTHFRHDPDDPTSLSRDQASVLYEDRQGTLWVGTGSGTPGPEERRCCGLNRFDRETETFTRFLPDPDDPRRLNDGRITALFEDSRGTFWVGTAGRDGLYTLDRATGVFTRHRYDPADPGKPSQPHRIKGTPRIFEPVTSFIYEDREGVLWIGASDGGLNRYDPVAGTQTHYEFNPDNPDDPRSLPTINVWRIYEARDGTLWIVTWEGVVKVAQRTALPHYLLDPAGPAAVNRVRSFYEDSEGVLWVGTGGGLYRYDRATRTVLNRYLHESRIRAIYEDSQGTFWIGTWGDGLFRFDPQTESFTQYVHRPGDETSLGDDRAWVIYEDRMGDLWIGTWGGLYRMDRQRGTFERLFDDPNDLASLYVNTVHSILEDRDGMFWIAAFASKDLGLIRFDRVKETFTRFLHGRVIPTIYEDQKGRFWVGTGHGLLRFDRETGTYRAFTPHNSDLPENTVSGIVEDEAGHLWLSTGRSSTSLVWLVRFDPETETFHTYPDQKAAPFNWHALYRSPRGEVFVGGANGFHAFFPEDLDAQGGEAEARAPEVALTGFRLFDEPVRPGTDAPLNVPIWEAEELRLSHDQNVFSFDFAGFHYRDPSQNRHQYMLEEYDESWREAGTDLTETYVKVPPGRYVFRVKAANSDGVWNEEGASIRVTILPPWWKTWWAYGVYGLLMIGAVVGAYRVQRRRLLRQAEVEQARLRAEAAELQARAMEAESERNRIEAEKAHELEAAYQHLKTTQQQLVQSEKLASLGQLTSGIAHELKNPLNFVNNFAEVNEELARELKELITDNRERRIAEVLEDLDDIASGVRLNSKHIAQHGKRADRIVQSMMDHARGGTGERYEVGLNAFVDEYVGLSYHAVQTQIPDLKVEIERDFGEAVGNVEMAPQEMSWALLNLLNNAFEAVHQRAQAADGSYTPMVKVLTRQVDGQVEIRVCDNGGGVSADIRDRIFEPFFTTKPTGTGTGLGLSLSYDIVTQGHGGTLTVESTEGEGATFIVTLPFTEKP